MSDSLEPGVLRDWLVESVRGLGTARVEINELNVFPIPDSDTGSNMLHTLSGAADAVAACDRDAHGGVIARAMADGAVGAARGNSGAILSQILVGIADAVEVTESAGFTALWTQGLRLASLAARRAVAQPAEGTMLTLLSVAAQAAADYEHLPPADFVREVAEACAEALDSTTEQLSVLAEAGVVDAGGRGLLVMMDALVVVVTGVRTPRRKYQGAGGLQDAAANDCLDDPGTMDFEVMYILECAAGEHVSQLRAELDALGDAVVIVGDSSLGAERFSVHVHCCDPGAAVEAGLTKGSVSAVRISCFALDAMRAGGEEVARPPVRRRAVVVVVDGDGAAQLFTGEGAVVVRCDEGLTGPQLAQAISAADSAHTIVMANGVLPSAELLAVGASVRSANRSVVMVPTGSMVQCVSALAVHDPHRSADDDAYAMAESAAATRYGSVAIADSPAISVAGAIEVGHALGLMRDEVLVVADAVGEAAIGLVDLLLSTGGELVTALCGADLDQSVIDDLERHIRVHYPGIEFAAYAGGQHQDVLQLGVD